MRLLPLLLLLAVTAACAQTAPVVNGGFETTTPVQPDAQGLYCGWKLTPAPLVPSHWTLNSAYPGTLEVVAEGAPEGTRFVRLTAPAGGSSHLYQASEGFRAGQWYRVSLLARNAPFEVCAYQYFTGPMNAPLVAAVRTASPIWKRYTAYYRPSGEGFQRASLALSTSAGAVLEVDDVRVEPLNPPQPPAAAPLRFENDTLRWSVAPDGTLGEFTCKPLGRDYRSTTDPLPIISVTRAGTEVPIYAVSGSADRLHVQFLEPDLQATLKVTTRPTHFLIEVLQVQPAEAEQLTVRFPLKRLQTMAGAFGATYDSEFGACLFCASYNAYNAPQGLKDTANLAGGCTAKRQLAGAKWVLLGTPYSQMKAAVMEAERANGLPCPMKEGKWLRDSPSNHKSYYFITSFHESQLETVIRYAKTAGFGQVIFGLGAWLSSTGHYQVNDRSFPGGLPGLQRVVKRLHAAGLEAGVHCFGPSISPNDAYITPRPDDRLAYKALPPLAEAAEAKATTLTLSGAPEVDLKTARYQGFPGYCLRLGDELITYSSVEPGPPYRLTGCHRGAYGTTAAAHPAGAPVKHLLQMWGYFTVDPDSTLADELTTNFANLFNEADLDMVYFDASDGIMDQYLDRWYYLNKLHSLYYSKFRKPVLYQTSNGTGTNLNWHLVPRSASADGHGDLKGYLDDRWPGILGMGSNWTSADVGWYYWFSDVRPDQMEYICARVLGIGGSISMETDVASTDRLVQSRQMYEMMGRWERARAERAFPAAVREKLLQPKQDFKLFGDSKHWQLYRAAYLEPRVVDALDGQQNTWTLTNDTGKPATLGFDFVRQGKGVISGDYDDPQAAVVEDFSDLGGYAADARNDYEKFVIGDAKVLTPGGVVREGVTTSYARAEGRSGGAALLLKAANKADVAGWTGLGRRFPAPRDLSGYQALGVWIHGDAKGETIRVQLRDSAGASADWLPQISYEGWRLHVFPLPKEAFNFKQVEYVLFYFNGLGPQVSAEVKVGPVKLLPKLTEPVEKGRPVLEINGRRVALPVDLRMGQALTHEGLGGVKLWPGGMAVARPVKVPASDLVLKPGANQVKLLWSEPGAFPGNVQALLYQVWPLE